MSKFKNYNKPPKTAFHVQSNKLNKQKHHISKEVKEFIPNPKTYDPKKKYPLYQSKMSYLTKPVTIPAEPINITVWEVTEDYYGKPYKDNIKRIQINISPLSNDDKDYLKNEGFVFDYTSPQWIVKKDFVGDNQEVKVSNEPTIGGGNLDTGLSKNEDYHSKYSQPSTEETEETKHYLDMDDDIPF